MALIMSSYSWEFKAQVRCLNHNLMYVSGCNSCQADNAGNAQCIATTLSTVKKITQNKWTGEIVHTLTQALKSSQVNYRYLRITERNDRIHRLHNELRVKSVHNLCSRRQTGLFKVVVLTWMLISIIISEVTVSQAGSDSFSSINGN